MKEPKCKGIKCGTEEFLEPSNEEEKDKLFSL
jgi:hypothetical protein